MKTITITDRRQIEDIIRKCPDTRPAVEYDEGYSSGLGLLSGDASSAQAEEAAFERNLRRRRKKRRKGQGL